MNTHIPFYFPWLGAASDDAPALVHHLLTVAAYQNVFVFLLVFLLTCFDIFLDLYSLFSSENKEVHSSC